MPYVLALADSRADLASVGGKGMSLARLSSAGLPVPPGFHVTTAAYRAFVDANGLQPDLLAALRGADPNQPTTLDSTSGAIRERFARALMPAEIADAIRAAYAALGGERRVAVRSSATAEDLPEASFAGQHETYLNIGGAEAVLEAVKTCWSSLWTARAIAYRAHRQIAPERMALAVVVQELICADAAGVLFTANPVSGKRDEAVISATWGLGEALVGGLETGDTLTVDKRRGAVLRRETAEKQVMTVRREAGTAEEAVPDGLRRAPVLSDAQAAELVRLGTQIEQLFGMPVDIEWTLAQGAVAIVQARPITALPIGQ